MTKISSILLLLVLNFPAHAEERWQQFGQPRPLVEGAVVEDWSRFNGPKDQPISSESPLLKNWSPSGPNLLWSIQKGEGYASPAVAGDKLVLFHRMEGREVVECRNARTGEPVWDYSYPVEYRDRYGYSAGPRASPVLGDGRVYVHGVTAWLTCLDLETGELIWQRDLTKDYDVPRYFFGKGSNPILHGDVLVLNLGGGEGQCMAGFDRKTGKTVWILEDEWGASYSSPTLARMHGRTVCLAMTGGESRPATGGLLIFDPDTGKRYLRFPWRSRKYESATACPPIHLGGGYVFVSECYDKGSVVLRVNPDFSFEVVWEKPEIGIHWMTPVKSDDYLYGVSGRHQQGAEVFCLNWKTGQILWKEAVGWTEDIAGREINLQLFRASMLWTGGRFLCLSEFGSLLRMDLSRKGWKIEERSQLFFAPETWTLPALSHGLLYVMQNDTDRMSGQPSRILCYDYRGK